MAESVERLSSGEIPAMSEGEGFSRVAAAAETEAVE
jgi:hypothetical protein